MGKRHPKLERHPGLELLVKVLLFVSVGIFIGLGIAVVLGLIPLLSISNDAAGQGVGSGTYQPTSNDAGSQGSGSGTYQPTPAYQPTIPTKPKLPSSFCSGLKSSDLKSACSDLAGKIDDDQRLRDWLTNSDAIQTDIDSLSEYAEKLGDGVEDYNDATTTQARMAAYTSYSTNAQLYANKMDALFTHIDIQTAHLQANKAYFDKLGLNTQQMINGFVSIKSDLKGSIIQVETNLKTMSGQLELETQQQQQLSGLLNLLLKLAAAG